MNEETGLLELLAGSGEKPYPQFGLKPGEGITGSILLTGKAEIINDVVSDPRYIKSEPQACSLLCVPLKTKNRIIGVINISSTKHIDYTAADLKVLAALTFQAAATIENAKFNYIRETFGCYLSDNLVNKLLAKPSALKLGGEKKHITIMMSDLRGFTTISERLSPEVVVAIINNYLKAMVDIIQKYHGTILEFIGDAIMVIFGAPIWTNDHADQAVACALEMQLAMQGVNQWNIANGFPEIEMGIGINTGHVIVGNIGSERRTKYGCVGSQVNLTGRIESYTVGGQIFIAEETLQTAASPIRIDKKMQVNPKGVKELITICDVGGIGEPYNLYLEHEITKLVLLPEEILVQVFLMEDKHCVGNGCSGRLKKLSFKEAVLYMEEKIPPLCSLKLQILSSGGKVIASDIYAKVKPKKENKAGINIQFTSVSQEGKELFKDIMHKCLPKELD